jgi:K+-transporting ATPase ATPase C chain
MRQHLAALRALIIFTIVLGIGFPLLVTGIAQLPGLKHRADGSLVHRNGQVVGSSLIGQSFTDADGKPVNKYFQSRPSAAGNGYDPTATSASNLGPEDIIDTLPDPSVKDDTGKPSLLSLVCSRSLAVGTLEGVDGQRPYCTADGPGAVLSVLHANGLIGPITHVVSVNQACPATPFVETYDGVRVECAKFGIDYRVGKIVLVHGPGKAWPDNPVPPDAVTASGSGLDPNISVAYAKLQAPRVAKTRGLPLADVLSVIADHTSGRALGFIGESAVNVLQLNLALDRLPGQQ